MHGVSILLTRELISSGIQSIDEALGGGLGTGEIFHIFGPGGVGKTTLALQFALNVVRNGNRVFYVNLEGQFPLVRLKQMTNTLFDKITPLITVVAPDNFKGQSALISNLHSILSSDVKLIIFDTIVSHYRKEHGPNTDNVMLNRKLNQQLAFIAHAARSIGFSVILVNQVRGDLNSGDHFLPVAESVLSYWSTYNLQITRTESKGYREFKLKREEDSEPIILVLSLNSSGFR